jgi:hypothetical protein
MAAGPVTALADVIVPTIFTPYTQQITEQKARLIQSRVLARDAFIDQLLAGGGATFHVPSFKDLDNDSERVSNDTTGGHFTGAANPDPLKTGTADELAVRLSRNNSWSSMDLTAELAGADPMQSIGNRVGYYWSRRLQAAFIATLTGVFADNAAAPSGTEHTLNDLTVDISGASYAAGVTDFSAEAFIDACTTMGDSSEDIVALMVHSVVYSRMQKNNLIDFIPDAVNPNVRIPTFLNREVIVDDSMPVSSGVYQTWLFGAGAVRLGVTSPKVPTETSRIPSGGNGGGQDVLYNRVTWCLHPSGHKYAGTAPTGGPTNASTSNNLAHAGSWQRVFPERKQIKIARLITREA